MRPIVLIHGGAGDISDEMIDDKLKGLKNSVKAGYSAFTSGGTALDAVEAAIRVMEDDVNFNAGHGAVTNIDGEIVMDSSIMDGRNLNVGSVTLIKNIAHPISLARLIMDRCPHAFLGAEGAVIFARQQGIPILPPGSLLTPSALEALDFFKKTNKMFDATEDEDSGSGGTVGAVAMDSFGNIAAGTSTGGLSGKMVGRIGDSPLIGCGTYADNASGAVSTTGHGESILKYCLAHSVVKEIELGKTAEEAVKCGIEGMTKRLKNIAGAICLSKNGEIGIYHNCRRMSWAYHTGREIRYGVARDEGIVEQI